MGRGLPLTNPLWTPPVFYGNTQAPISNTPVIFSKGVKKVVRIVKTKIPGLPETIQRQVISTKPIREEILIPIRDDRTIDILERAERSRSPHYDRSIYNRYYPPSHRSERSRSPKPYPSYPDNRERFERQTIHSHSEHYDDRYHRESYDRDRFYRDEYKKYEYGDDRKRDRYDNRLRSREYNDFHEQQKGSDLNNKYSKETKQDEPKDSKRPREENESEKQEPKMSRTKLAIPEDERRKKRVEKFGFVS